MDVTTIAQLLVNAGFRVKGLNAAKTHLLVEDPSCIIRNFEVFLEYAWAIISLITAFLLLGWAISLIRGAKTDITTNIRNLVIMFGVLSVTAPIINVIYGGDLMGRTCHIVEIPLSDVQKILEVRNSNLSKEEKLFENLNIFDSGMRNEFNQPTDLNPVSVPEFDLTIDPETGDVTIQTPAPDDDTPPPPSPSIIEPQAVTPPQPTTPENEDSEPSASTKIANEAPIYATVVSRKVIEYTHANGSKYRKKDGSLAWRHTNPGNIVNSTFATDHGAIGRGRKFAIFPTKDIGAAAIIDLLRSPSYRNLSIINAIKRYAPAADNNDPVRYANTISLKTGLDINRTLNTLDDAEMRKVADIIQQVEGWRTGTILYE